MKDQLALGTPPAPCPPGIAPVVGQILAAAQSIAFSTTIARKSWGVSVGPGRRYVLRPDARGTCCCALGAYLVVHKVVADEHDRSPHATLVRVLGITSAQLSAFVAGFDGTVDPPGTEWTQYGRWVADELGLMVLEVDPLS